MFFSWCKKKIIRSWYNIEKKLGIDTVEGWIINGLPLCVGGGLLFVGFCVGLGLLVCKLMGRI